MRRKIKILTAGMLAAVMTLTNVPMGVGVQNNSDVNVYADADEEFEYVVGNTTYTYEVLEDGTISIEDCSTSDTKIVIPEEIGGKKVTSIGDWAFEDCSSLSKIEIPISVTSIGWYAFEGCSSLTKIEIPTSVTGIGDGTFQGCSSLSEIEIPTSVTSIGDFAFYGCSSLSEIEIPTSVTSIGDGAFSSCSSLSEIEIPTSVTSIGGGAFRHCSSLTKIEVDSNNKNYASENGVLFNKDKTGLICCPSGKSGTYKIPTSVTSIGYGAFWDCSSLSEIEIPTSVTSIGSYAFEDCSSLSEIEIPTSVTSIGDSAFKGCSSLSGIEIPTGVTSIGDWAFKGCSSLSEIEIPTSVTSIGYRAFEDCSSLTKVELPTSIISIGDRAFSNCSSLTKIEVDSNNKNYASENGVLFNKEKTELICCPSGKSGAYKIPTSVTSIGYRAFEDCSSLTKVELPTSVTSIGDWAFEDCSSLSKIEIPTSVTSIGDGAFGDCSSLTKIEVDSNNKNYASENGVLFNKNKTELICCPSGKSGAYEIPTSVTGIGWYAFYGCSSLSEIEIPTSVTSIGYGAFWDCSSLSEIEIPTSVTYIVNYAFKGCSSLSEIEIPTSVTGIGWYAFEDCSSLSEIEIPTSVTYIGDCAFGYYYDENWVYTKMDEFTIYGYSGTEAEKYAKDNGFKFIRMSDLHSDDEVIIKFTSDSLPEKAELVTKLIDTASEEYVKISENFEKYLSGLSKEESAAIKYHAYEIHVTDNNNNIVQPKDKVTVSIPLPEGFAGKDSKVYRMEDNGFLTDMNAKVQGDYLVFETNHFSLYLVVNHNISGNILYGDANGDGAIDSADAVLIKKYLAGYKDLGINEEACDVNLDGEVTSADAVLVLKKLAGYDVVLGK